MVVERDQNHPRKRDEFGELKSMPVCGTKTGAHNCFSRQARESDLSEYGVGIVVYFQFLKYMACVFLILGILSVPTMIFSFYGTKPDGSFTSIASSISIGNLGQA